MNDNVLDILDINALIASGEGESKDSGVELLRVFSAEGKPLGLVPRPLCHRLGLLHKAVFCFIAAPDGTLLLQTRKDGRLDVAVGGHMSGRDDSTEDALLREIHEETGLDLRGDRLQNITEYRRHSPDRLSKPRDMNNELRTLFFVELSRDECNMLDARFSDRPDKIAVLRVQWFRLADVLKACDADQAADGLAGSISHYLLWLLNHGR